ncbi:MAG: Hsp20/alpha crystallin family protein [Acidobacteriia bacterium]|nr:Hsp20/alpha crystallin family protein [Terriglobia bacterium]
MSKSHKRNPYDQVRSTLILEAEEILGRLEVGNWIPNVDICETADAVVVRVELPGIEPADIRITIEGNLLRVQGTKREPAAVRERISYYCLERRYGKFDRHITIDWVVDGARSSATLVDGILTIAIPRIENRRGRIFEIPITSKQQGNRKGTT